jgi:hypothetical protein
VGVRDGSDVDVATGGGVVVVVTGNVETEVTGAGDAPRESEDDSGRLPPSLALSAAPRSKGVHFAAFFFFLKVYLLELWDSKPVGFAREGWELPSIGSWPPRLVDMAASAKVRGRPEGAVVPKVRAE